MARGTDLPPDSEPTPTRPARVRGRKRKVLAVRLIEFAIVLPLIAVITLVFVANYRVLTVPAWMVERVEARLNAQVPQGDRVRLEQLGIGLDFRDRAIIVDVLDARLERRALADRVHLPKLSLEFNLAGISRGMLQVRHVRVAGGTLRLTRAEDGQFDLGFGRDAETIAQLPASWAEVLDAVDAVLMHPLAAQLSSVEAGALRVVLSDAVSGRRLSLSEGAVTLRRDGRSTELVIAADLSRARCGAAPGTFRLALSRTPGAGAGLDLRMIGGRSDDLRMVFNVDAGTAQDATGRVDVLSVLQAGVDMWAVGEVREDGTLSPLEARVALENGVIPGWEGAAFDLATLEVLLDPAARRLEVRRAEVRAPQAKVTATGQILAGDTLNDPLVVQLALSDIVVDPEGVLPNPAAFDTGVLEGRLHMAPLRFEIGQAMVAAGPSVARASGEVWVPEPGAIAANLSLSADRVAASTVTSLWPDAVAQKTRIWITENISGGTITDFAAALRKDADNPRPAITGGFGFEGASVRYLRDMPVAQDASGIANFHDNRFSLRIDTARVPAGPWGDVDIGGTSFTVPNTRIKPAVGEVDLMISGPIPAVLSVLDNKPLSVLERAKRSADFVQGQASVQGWLEVPLVKGVPLENLDFAFDGVLTDVSSGVLVPGRQITSAELALRVTPDAVEVRGPLELDAVPMRATWRQPLPQSKGTEPGPGALTGRFAISAQTLAAFGIDLTAFGLSGQAPAEFEMSLDPARPQRLQLRSSLEGLGANIPALSWRKTPDATGDLRLEIATGEQPVAVPVMSISAPGLAVEGAISLAEGGGLERALLSRLEVGNWLSATADIRGRGPGRAPSVAITSGTADLRRVNFDAGASTSVGGQSVPLNIVLDSITISDGIVLNNVSAEISTQGGTNGRFTGLLNGGAPIAGTLVPSAQGTAVRIRGDNAGATLASAGVFRNGNGGSFDLRLVPRAGQGRYAGSLDIEDMRVRDAPALASLLSAVSVVGLLEQLGGEGLFFSDIEADFELEPGAVRVTRGAAFGPSLGLTLDGTYVLTSRALDMQGVVSPFYLVNGLFGGLFAPRDEGLIGISYALSGPASAPQVRVNPLSVLTPCLFREVFRRAPPAPTE